MASKKANNSINLFGIFVCANVSTCLISSIKTIHYSFCNMMLDTTNLIDIHNFDDDIVVIVHNTLANTCVVHEV